MKGATRMAKQFGGKRPQNLRHTLRRFGDYLGRHKIMLAVVGTLAAVSALAALLGTYMIRPVVNGVLENGSVSYLAGVVALTAVIYIVGALSTLGYTQLMVRAAQKILQDIRRDLFAHLQTLPLHYFDANRKGDLMSLFTNDVDTISDALNNSFAVVIQTFIQVVGTLVLLFVLNWRLSLLVVVGYVAMFWYINYSTKRSRVYYASQQSSLGELDAYMEEMIAGQKVVKVFNHQQADMAEFAARNEKLREAGTGAQSYAATMIPAVVSIGYINYAVIAVVGGLMVMQGWSDLGSLASYLVFVRQTTLPINQFTQQGNFLLAALAGAERIFTVMEEKPEIDEGRIELVRAEKAARRHADALHPQDRPVGVVRPQQARRTAGAAARRRAVPRCQLRLHARPDDLAKPVALREAGAEDRLCRLHRRGQNDDHEPHQPLLRGVGRLHHLRRDGRAAD